MKTSYYNIFFPLEDKIVGYNTYTNDFILLIPELYDIFLEAEQTDVKNLESIHPDFYKYLIEKQFIIPKNTNELEKVKELVAAIDNNDETFEIIINPTMNCNFKCWYCYETHIKKSKMDAITINNTISLINNVIKRNGLKKLQLSWFGGEPLLYFNEVILPLLEKANELTATKNISFSSNITTNGLLITEELLNYCLSYGLKGFQITLDGHRERHNVVRYISKTKGSYDQIVKNIKLCLKKGININCRLNISKEFFDGNERNIIDDFSDISEKENEYLIFSFQKVWQEESNLDLNFASLIKDFKTKNFKIADFGQDTVRNSCYADKKNQALINYNGEVFKCSARDFTSDNKDGVLLSDGAISWNEKFEERMDAKFKNPPCLSCKILPICNGGCSQLAVENLGKDYCVYDFDYSKKLDVVKQKYLHVIS